MEPEGTGLGRLQEMSSLVVTATDCLCDQTAYPSLDSPVSNAEYGKGIQRGQDQLPDDNLALAGPLSCPGLPLAPTEPPSH